MLNPYKEFLVHFLHVPARSIYNGKNSLHYHYSFEMKKSSNENAVDLIEPLVHFECVLSCIIQKFLENEDVCVCVRVLVCV